MLTIILFIIRVMNYEYIIIIKIIVLMLTIILFIITLIGMK